VGWNPTLNNLSFPQKEIQMAKEQTFTVAIEIREIYHVEIDAKDQQEAQATAEEMKSGDVRTEGSLQNVETTVVDVQEV
jgi:hypothetical protein